MTDTPKQIWVIDGFEVYTMWQDEPTCVEYVCADLYQNLRKKMTETKAYELLRRHHSAALGMSDEHTDYGGRPRSDMGPHSLYIATGEYLRDLCKGYKDED